MQLLGPKVIKKSLRQVIQRLGRRLSIQNPSVKAGDILCLPPELQLAIYHNLDIEGKRQLRLVCRAFNNLLALEVVYDELRIALEKQTIFFIKGASREDEFGYKPFIIKEVSRPSKNDSGETQHLSVDVYWPKFMRDEEELGDERVSIQMEMSELSVTGTLFDEDRIQAVDYSTTLSGKLEKVSACLLRNRFDCSECNNERSVCPGCGGFSRRYEC
ncbi:hypothetical protein D9757_007340 [Collybiopsis confluens]|uniref:F-box domain-containing protein n=1 Tax=Collybiopsis confluens TaxID=2823264 RepID=A0A8H5M6N3_9AGAR|nr:hypothetical protein D9757_007340 [Collybiopsis confluens]